MAAALIWYLVVFGSYGRVEKVFLLLTLVFFAYPVAAILARPHWSEVARGAFIPTIRYDSQYLTLLVGLIGTTITPYMQLFQQSSIVERGSARRHYGQSGSTYAGSVASTSCPFSWSSPPRPLTPSARRRLEAADATALAPVARRCEMVFAIGLLGATMLAATVLPPATSYAISEAFGFAKGVNPITGVRRYTSVCSRH